MKLNKVQKGILTRIRNKGSVEVDMKNQTPTNKVIRKLWQEGLVYPVGRPRGTGPQTFKLSRFGWMVANG